MILLYTIGIKLYVLMVRVAALFNPKAKLMIRGRKKIFERITKEVGADKGIVWFHAASLGEFEQGRPLIEKIKAKYPDKKIMLTFFSPSGYEIRKDYKGADYVFYLPFDGAVNAKKFVESVQPEMAFFVKYEYWYYYLNELSKRNIPTYIISAIYRKEQPFFKWYGGFWKRMLECYDKIFVQNSDSADLLKSLGINNCYVAGDTRFDRVNDIASKAQNLPLVQSFVNGKDTVVCGSTWPKDEENIAEYIKTCNTDFKWIIAPHETHESHIQDILNKLDGKAVRYTESEGKDISEAKVLIIDCIGILSSVYQYGKMSYIGGGFGKGIHNTLEAATFGLSVTFGPNYHKFKEAKDLIACGGAFTYNEYSELKNIFDRLTTDAEYMKECGKKAADYIAANTGSTDMIIKECF